MNNVRVLVTGSSRGIGLGIAEAFLRAGGYVMLNGRQEDTLLTERDRLHKNWGERLHACPADVSDPDASKRLVEYTISRFGGLDVLVNNAGSELFGLFQDMEPYQLRGVIDSNLMAVMYPTLFALPGMVKAKKGSVVNITSIWGLLGASCEGAYSAAKAGVIGFTKSLAKELGPSGVRVNAIALGAFDTDMNARLADDEKQAFIDNIPLGRFGQAKEAGDLAVYLAGAGAGYITGQVVSMDGGYV